MAQRRFPNESEVPKPSESTLPVKQIHQALKANALQVQRGRLPFFEPFVVHLCFLISLVSFFFLTLSWSLGSQGISLTRTNSPNQVLRSLNIRFSPMTFDEFFLECVVQTVLLCCLDYSRRRKNTGRACGTLMPTC